MKKGLVGMPALGLAPLCALAVDGVMLINQSSAMAGNVTPRAAPGFPVSITVPGSYRLSRDLTVDANTTAIVISSRHARPQWLRYSP